MKITSRKDGDILHITVSGTVDTSRAEILKSELDKIVLENPRKVVMDFSQVPMMGSSGIAKILLFYRRLDSMNAGLEIIGVQEALYNSFKTVRMQNLFPIHMK